MGANVDTEADNFNPAALEVVKTFDAKYASALVDFTTQDSEDTYTTYTLRVRKFDDNYIVDDVHLFTVTDCANAVLSANDSEETPTNEIV